MLKKTSFFSSRILPTGKKPEPRIPKTFVFTKEIRTYCAALSRGKLTHRRFVNTFAGIMKLDKAFGRYANFVGDNPEKQVRHSLHDYRLVGLNAISAHLKANLTKDRASEKLLKGRSVRSEIHHFYLTHLKNIKKHL